MILTKIKHIFIPDFNYENYFFLVYIYLPMYVTSVSIYKGVYHWCERLVYLYFILNYLSSSAWKLTLLPTNMIPSIVLNEISSPS